MAIKKPVIPKAPKPTADKADYTSITDLQNKLFKSLGTVFDPTAKPLTDEDLLADDFEKKTSLDYDEPIVNPYRDLAEKARTYAKDSSI